MIHPASQYAPDFPPEKWDPRHRMLLEPFATNLDGFASVIHNLPAEVVGALCSRASRAQGSLLRVLLNEYLLPIVDGEDRELSSELLETVKFLRTHGFKNILNNQRAQKFYARWLSQYGDDSISQLTGTHVVFWGISQVAMKFVEDQRIGLEPIEKSTRFVNFKEKIGGRYLYHTPFLDLREIGMLTEYVSVLDNLFDAYAELQQPLLDWLKKKYNVKESVLEKKMFDTLRGLLPMATLGQVAFRGNAQAYEYLLNRTTKHDIGELRWLASVLRTELDKEIPSLLLRLDDEKSSRYQEYRGTRTSRIRDFVEDLCEELSDEYGGEPGFLESGTKPSAELVEWDRELEARIATAIMWPEGHMSWNRAMELSRNMSVSQRKELFGRHFSGRSERWMKVGRAFENSFLRFEILMNNGAYRDLHRHRMLTQERQRFSVHHGYDVPSEVKEAGLSDKFCEAIDRATELYLQIEQHGGKFLDIAQYASALAHRLRFYQFENVREYFWETELRTISQGHPDYRFIEQEKHRLALEKFPLLFSHAMVDTEDYPLARREVEEKAAAKETRILDGLQKRGDSPKS